MTHNEPSKDNMSDEEMRSKIAEAANWEQPNHAPGVVWVPFPDGRREADPLTDLNAMHEAEESLVTTGAWIEYCKNLAQLCYVNKTAHETAVRYHNGDLDGVWHDLGSLVRATARQRAVAFLKTKQLL